MDIKKFDAWVEDNRSSINAKFVAEQVVPNGGLPPMSFMEFAKIEFQNLRDEPVPQSLGDNFSSPVKSENTQTTRMPVQIIVEDGKVIEVIGLSQTYQVQYIEKENFRLKNNDIFTFTKALAKFYGNEKFVDLKYIDCIGKEMEIVDIIQHTPESDIVIMFGEVDNSEDIHEIEERELVKLISIIEIQKNRG